MSVYRNWRSWNGWSWHVALLQRKSLQKVPDYISTLLVNLPGKRLDAILLFSAGAFAGCIFENGKPLFHKCIKKYVVRAKRGTAQSTRDNQGLIPAQKLIKLFKETSRNQWERNCGEKMRKNSVARSRSRLQSGERPCRNARRSFAEHRNIRNRWSCSHCIELSKIKRS